VTARQWYEKAAAQGDARAQYSLGVLYARGYGVPQAYAKAREWYEKASAQSYASGQNNLGYLYADGKGVPKDEKMEWSGYAKLPSRETRTGKIHSARCTAMDAACRRTMCEHICGTASQQPIRRVFCRSRQRTIEM